MRINILSPKMKKLFNIDNAKMSRSVFKGLNVKCLIDVQLNLKFHWEKSAP